MRRKRKISVIIKLIGLLLFSIVLSLSIATFAVDFYLKNIFTNNSKEQIAHIFTHIGKELKEIEDNLFNRAKVIGSNDVAQATIRIVNLYEDKQNYNKELFNNPKEELANILLKHIKISLLESIAMMDEDDNLVAFAKVYYKDGFKKYQMGYISYKDGKKIFNTKKEDESKWVNEDKNIKFFTNYNIFNKIGYMVQDSFLNLYSFSTIKHDENVIGYLRINKSLTKSDIQQQSSAANIELSFEVKNKIKKDIKDNSVLLFSKIDSNQIHMYENEFSFESFAIIPSIKNETIYIKAIANKQYLNSAINNSRVTLFLIAIGTAVFISILGLLVIKEIIIFPLHTIMENIKYIKRGNYKKQVKIANDDELGKIARSFNEMTKLIQKREDELIESKDKLYEALSIAKLGSWQIDYTSNTIECSHEMYEILQRDINDKFNDVESFKYYIHQDDRQRYEEVFRDSVIQNIDFEIEYRVLLHNSKIGYLQSKAKHKYDENRRIVKSIGTILDITKIKNLEKENIEKEQMLYQQSKMAAMGEMIGNIAHQWRQPISIITMWSNNIIADIEMGEVNNENLKKYAFSINEQTKHLSQTIDDFRNFFTPNKIKNRFTLQNSIDKTMNLLKATLNNHGIEVIENIEKITIEALENELTQAILNIIKNAKDILVTLPKESRKIIFIDIFKKQTEVIIEIKDNGGGVPKEIKDKIFEPYFTTKHKSIGTGIGLYMTESIISKHLKGDIFVQNTTYSFEGVEYNGAKFIIKIPIEEL
jgi:signal transduction histidine kinase/methyl-accepting chemotaxis protein